MAPVNKPGDLAGLLMGIADHLIPKHAGPDLQLTYQVGRPFVEQAAKQAARKVTKNPLWMQVLGRVAELHNAGVQHEQDQARIRHEAEMKAKAEHEEAERLKRQAAEMKYSTPTVDAPASPGAKTYKETWGGNF